VVSFPVAPCVTVWWTVRFWGSHGGPGVVWTVVLAAVLAEGVAGAAWTALVAFRASTPRLLAGVVVGGALAVWWLASLSRGTDPPAPRQMFWIVGMMAPVVAYALTSRGARAVLRLVVAAIVGIATAWAGILVVFVVALVFQAGDGLASNAGALTVLVLGSALVHAVVFRVAVGRGTAAT
jgi:hypothetical protein